MVDFFYYPHMGVMDLIREDWPDPKAMNDELHAMGFHSMISVWPRFASGSRYYDILKNNGWFYHLADGQPTVGRDAKTARANGDWSRKGIRANGGQPRSGSGSSQFIEEENNGAGLLWTGHPF